jgi:hypothetical protein
MSSKCETHKALITRFIGYWEDEGFEDHELSIFKHDRDTFIELLREGERSGRTILNRPFKLVCEITSKGSDSGSDRPEGLTYDSDEQSSSFGRGKFLDQHWIRIDDVKGWYEMCRNTHGAACNSAAFIQEPNARPVFLIDTWDQCLVPAGAGDSYMILSYVLGSVDFISCPKIIATSFNARRPSVRKVSWNAFQSQF